MQQLQLQQQQQQQQQLQQQQQQQAAAQAKASQRAAADPLGVQPQARQPHAGPGRPSESAASAIERAAAADGGGAKSRAGQSKQAARGDGSSAQPTGNSAHANLARLRAEAEALALREVGDRLDDVDAVQIAGWGLARCSFRAVGPFYPWTQGFVGCGFLSEQRRMNRSAYMRMTEVCVWAEQVMKQQEEEAKAEKAQKAKVGPTRSVARSLEYYFMLFWGTDLKFPSKVNIKAYS